MRPGVPGRTSGVLLLLAVLLASGGARAQEGEEDRPLTKSELVRMLVDSGLDQGEIAERIRRGCLTFDPGAGDLEDLERVGAGAEVREEVEACGRQVRISFASPREVGRVGETVDIEARAERQGRPAGGLRLLLQEEGQTIASARTDGTGRVRFRIPSGTALESRRLRLRARPVPAGGEPTLTLEVRPGPPRQADLAMSVDPPEAGPLEVSARVRDAFGHDVPGAVVHLAPGAPGSEGDTLRLEGRTGSDGRVRFVVPEDRLPWGSPLVLVHRRDTLAVSRPLPTLARAGPDGPGEEAPSIADAAARDGPEERVEPAASESAGIGSPTGEERAGIELGPGEADLRRGRSLAAAAWFRRAADLRPEDAEAWTGLARAWLAAGEPGLAREAFLEGRRRASDSAAVEAAVDRAGGLPPWGRIRIFGGGAWQADEGRDFGGLEVRVRPEPGFALWAGYESTLVSEDPFLVRGGSDVATLSGGASVSYGPERAVTTGLSVASLDHGTDLRQLVYRVQNELRLSREGRPLRWRIGGTLARWFDRDDWLLSTEVELPVADDAALVPSLHLGETSGTAATAEGRLPATEVRARLGALLQPSEDWSVAPALSYGRVTPLEEDEAGVPVNSGVSVADTLEAGDLVEARLRLAYRVGPAVSLLLRGRYQSPPFGDPFSDLALGLSYALR